MIILWADDDCEGALDPLSRLLERRGQFTLSRAVSYTKAVEQLVRSEHGAQIDALLVDIILPYGDGRGSLSTDLGIQLAIKATEYGVKSIVFLTVVPLQEVSDKISNLKLRYPSVEWSHFDKLDLLNEINSVITHLKRNGA